MRLAVTIAVLCLGRLTRAQPGKLIITKTVRSTCTQRTTSLALPLEGWISTNGTTLPYTFEQFTSSPGPSTSSASAIFTSSLSATSVPQVSSLSSTVSARQSIDSLAAAQSLPSGSTSTIWTSLESASSPASVIVSPGLPGNSVPEVSNLLSIASVTSQSAAATITAASSAAITRISGGQVTSVVLGNGSTSTYTAGGTTLVTFGIAEPTATPTSTGVQDADIGPCPEYNGRVYKGIDGVAFLVACGTTYDGVVLSTLSRRSLHKRATPDDCTTQCIALSGCIASSYSSELCTFFSSISGQTQLDVPVYSAARLVLDPAGSANTSTIPDSSQLLSSTQSSSPLLGDQEIRTTTEQLISISTAFFTLPASTITTTLPASSFTVTTQLPGQTTTALVVSVLPARTTTVVQPASTRTSFITLTEMPQAETFTKPAETVVSTRFSILPASSFTTTVERTYSASPIVVTTSLPGQTTTAVFTTSLEASTATITTVSIREASTLTQYITSTLPRQTDTLQLSGPIETVLVSTTLVLPASTETVFVPTTVVSTQVPSTETQIFTYTTSYWETITTTTSLPAETVSLLAPTSYIISTYITSYPVTTTAVSTQLVTLTSTQNVTQDITLPASTQILTYPTTETFISTYLTTETLSYPVTETVTSTQLFTFTSVQDVTLPAVTQTSTQETLIVSTFITTEVSTFSATTTATTTQMVTLTSVQTVSQDVTLPATTLRETELVPTTVISTERNTIISTQLDPTTVISTQLASTIVETQLVPTTVVSTERNTIVSTELVPTTIVELASTRVETQTILTTAISTQLNTIISTQPIPTTVVSTQLNTIFSTQLIPTTLISTQQTTVVSTQLASTRIETQLIPTTVISTQLNTIVSTQLVPTTLVSTQQTTVVSTQLASTRVETQLVPTTVVTTQLASTQTQTITQTTTITSIPPAVTVYRSPPVPTCLSRNDGQPYLAPDGSQYIMLCGRDNSGDSIIGITVPVTSYSACLDRCSLQGTSCMGVTWKASQQRCLLKQFMMPIAAGGTSSTMIDSAVRVSGPAGTDAWTQRITNGGFDTGTFDSWTTTGNCAVVGNAAVVSLSSSDNENTIGFQQSFSVNAGDVFYVTYSYSVSDLVSIPNYQGLYGQFGYPQLTAIIGQQRLFNAQILSNTDARTVHASGVFSSTSGYFEIELYVEGISSCTVTIDNIVLYTYSPSAGQDPIQYTPGTIFGPTDLAVNQPYWPAYYDRYNSFFVGFQVITAAVNVQSTFTFSATLTITIGPGDTCAFSLTARSLPDGIQYLPRYASATRFFFDSDNFSANETLNLTVSTTALAGFPVRYLWVDFACNLGNADNQIKFDNLIFVADP